MMNTNLQNEAPKEINARKRKLSEPDCSDTIEDRRNNLDSKSVNKISTVNLDQFRNNGEILRRALEKPASKGGNQQNMIYCPNCKHTFYNFKSEVMEVDSKPVPEEPKLQCSTPNNVPGGGQLRL